MSVFSLLRGLKVEVDSSVNKVSISGISLKYVCRDLEKYLGTKMLYNILDKATYAEIKLSTFYLPDFYHSINTLLYNPKFKRRTTSTRELLAIKEELEKIPLVANIKKIQNTDPINIPKIDKSKLDKIFNGMKLFDYQDKFIDECIWKAQLLDLKGYLLDAPPGAGKSYGSLALMEMLNIDTVIIICPKKAVNDVWDETITRIYSEPQSYSMSLPVLHGPSKPAGFDINDRFIVCHYEAIGKLNEYLDSVKIPNKRYSCLLDECLHPDTEVLTPTGFKSIKDITTDDKVLQYNPDGSNTWVNPSRVVKKPTFESHQYVNSRWEQVVTPNHRMIFENRHWKNGELSLREKLSKDFYPGNDNYAIVSGILMNDGKTKLTPLERLLIAIQADGSINYVSEVSKFIKIEFHLTKERLIDC